MEEPDLPLPSGLVPLALHATDTALAIVCAPCRLLLFAAASRRLLLDVTLPGEQLLGGTGTCAVLSDAAAWLGWADPAIGLCASPVPQPSSHAAAGGGGAAGSTAAAALCVPNIDAVQLVWHRDTLGALQLVSAEASGAVRLWHPEAALLDGEVAGDGAVLHDADTAIVQLDARDGWLLVSTLARSVLIAVCCRDSNRADSDMLWMLWVRQNAVDPLTRAPILPRSCPRPRARARCSSFRSGRPSATAATARAS